MPDAGMLAWRQYRLERRLFWRNPSAAFFNFLLPLLFLVAGGLILHGNQSQLNKLVPAIAGMSVMSTTFTALAYNIVFLRERGVLKRIRGTPLPPISYFGGVGANAVTNTSLQIVIVIVAGRVFFGIGWPKDWLELVVFVSFYVFDSSSAPAFLRTIAEALPLYPLIHGLSGALVTGTSLATNISDLGVIAVWAALGIWLAVRGFTWEQRRS